MALVQCTFIEDLFLRTWQGWAFEYVLTQEIVPKVAWVGHYFMRLWYTDIVKRLLRMKLYITCSCNI